MNDKKEKPIIFSTPMVKAILAGNKTMTRRVVKEPVCTDKNGFISIKGFWMHPQKDTDHAFDGIAPYCIGDHLWVRETFTKAPNGDYIYRADPMFDDCGKGDISWDWTPSISMPREAARIFLQIKNVRIERLQEITESDAQKEGFLKGYANGKTYIDNKSGFTALWNRINRGRYCWVQNPYVFVYEFVRAKLELAMETMKGGRENGKA
ncbi:MAG: hypothetical protein LBJ41_05790 [Treponema sp.]|jgi:hypothetical protein|nr:hypothetical protein [Treponema sp.]